MSDDARRPDASAPITHTDHHDVMMEGEEPPPPGVKTMALVRWALLGLAGILAIFTWWSYAAAQIGGTAGSSQAAAKYHCPMHPQIVSSEPGECPICHMTLELIAPTSRANPDDTSAQTRGDTKALGGSTRPSAPQPAATMDTLVPPAGKTKTAVTPGTLTPGRVAPGAPPPGTAPIKLGLDRIQAIGVRTAVVGEESASQTLRVTAVVAPTEQGVAEVHVRTPGFVERILVNQSGVAVGYQQLLFTIYSPEIFQAQSELIVAQQWAGADARASTATSSRLKLELLGMANKDIDNVIKTREPMRAIPVYAPQAGYVAKKNVVQGSYLTPEMVLYEIQDRSHVYVVADVFQSDVAFIQKGTAGRFTPARSADDAIDVRVDLIYPTLNAEARTTRVRMQVKNGKGVTFSPGDYGSVAFATPSRKAVTVPRDAVIDTGLYTYVFVVEQEGTFSPHAVVLGQEQGEMFTVLSGVAAGERVVSGATFLIDSESRLQASAAQVAAVQPAIGTNSSQLNGDGLSCQSIDRTKFPDKWIECQKCTQVHHGMGSMEADCKNAIQKPWN